jgi:signal transduction histidine kinase
VLQCAALAGLYYGSARFGYKVGFSGPIAAMVWLPVGIAISGLSLFGLALWPGVLVGDLLANDYSTVLLGPAIAQTAGNMLECLVAAYLIRRLMKRGSPLRTVTGVTGIIGAAALGTAISAIVGPLSIYIGGVLGDESLFTVMRTWWLGDFCGVLVVVPLVLAWHTLPFRRLSRAELVEGAAMIAVVALLAELSSHSTEPIAYLVFPALIWAAVRFGDAGATLAVTVAVAITVWGTTHYEGAFVFDSITHSVLSTQLFVLVAVISTLYLAAIVAEREEFAVQVGESRAEAFRAADVERRRIERNLHDGAQQRLLALGVRLRLAADRARGADSNLASDFDDAERELDVALEELRDLAHGTHPSVLTELGLADAIRSVAARSAIPVTSLLLPAGKVDQAAEAVAYYIVLEGVANAQRHSFADSIQVWVVSEPDGLRIAVSDNGVGGAVERLDSGLSGLRERVAAAGGSLTVESAAGSGTRLSALVPTTA